MNRSTIDRAWDFGRGAAVGAVALAAIGFWWGGWTTQGRHLDAIKVASDSATVAALAPLCVDSFLKDDDAVEQKVEMMKASSWNRGAFIEKGGWATMPGAKAPNTAVAKACADLLASK